MFSAHSIIKKTADIPASITERLHGADDIDRCARFTSSRKTFGFFKVFCTRLLSHRDPAKSTGPLKICCDDLSRIRRSGRRPLKRLNGNRYLIGPYTGDFNAQIREGRTGGQRTGGYAGSKECAARKAVLRERFHKNLP